MCNWNNFVVWIAMGMDRVLGPLDSFIVFLLLMLTGTGMQRLLGV